MGLIDRYGRRINYLRISVTDRCNLRCIYCVSQREIRPKSSSRILSYEEILRVATIGARLGIDKIRLTGGEPLLRKDLVKLLEKLRRIRQLKDLSLTTNGIYLKKFARSLKEGGLERVNISLDSLRRRRYKSLTGGNLKDALDGIDSAIQSGLNPVKINVVVMKGVNDDEIFEFVKFARERLVEVRFIEFMPIGRFWSRRRFIRIEEIKRRLDGYFSDGRISFLGTLSEPMCTKCNRIRLSSEGRLRPCLFLAKEISLDGTDREIVKRFFASVSLKPRIGVSSIKGAGTFKGTSMLRIGG
jgi:cyclic pyranopterin phosphate synthase